MDYGVAGKEPWEMTRGERRGGGARGDKSSSAQPSSAQQRVGLAKHTHKELSAGFLTKRAATSAGIFECVLMSKQPWRGVSAGGQGAGIQDHRSLGCSASELYLVGRY